MTDPRVYIREGKPLIPQRPVKSRTAAFVLYYDFVFGTKWKAPAFTSASAAARMADIIIETCERNGYGVWGVAVMPEHVHLLVNLRPDVAPATAARMIKGAAAREFHRAAGGEGSLWSDGYAVEAVGTKNAYQVLTYIGRQDERHGVIKTTPAKAAARGSAGQEPAVETAGIGD